jgi:hypothetical protein
MTEGCGPVRRRRVFYIGGFDPANPRRYHRLFAAESVKQAALIGARIEVGRAKQRDELAWGWHVRAERSGGVVEIDYECLRWNDIVKRYWPKDGPRFFLKIWRTFFVFRRRGVLALPSRTALATAFTPVVVLTGVALIYALVVAGLCWLGAVAAMAAGLHWWIGAAPPLLLWLAAIPVWRRVDRLLPVGWLGRAMIWVSDAERGLHPETEARQQAFARRVVDAAHEPGWDEILIVGHSMGCQLAVRTLGQALQLDPSLGERGTPLSLLTLGQVIPLYSLMTDAPAYRRDFRAAVEATHVPWVDFTGPADTGSVGDVHPLTGLGLAMPPDRPVRRSPRFHTLMTDAAYRRLRRSPLDFHFQYLMATELAGGYDYFEITTGPRRLSQTGTAGGVEQLVSGRARSSESSA